MRQCHYRRSTLSKLCKRLITSSVVETSHVTLNSTADEIEFHGKWTMFCDCVTSFSILESFTPNSCPIFTMGGFTTFKVSSTENTETFCRTLKFTGSLARNSESSLTRNWMQHWRSAYATSSGNWYSVNFDSKKKPLYGLGSR